MVLGFFFLCLLKLTSKLNISISRNGIYCSIYFFPLKIWGRDEKMVQWVEHLLQAWVWISRTSHRVRHGSTRLRSQCSHGKIGVETGESREADSPAGLSHTAANSQETLSPTGKEAKTGAQGCPFVSTHSYSLWQELTHSHTTDRHTCVCAHHTHTKNFFKLIFEEVPQYLLSSSISKPGVKSILILLYVISLSLNLCSCCPAFY